MNIEWQCGTSVPVQSCHLGRGCKNINFIRILALSGPVRKRTNPNPSIFLTESEATLESGPRSAGLTCPAHCRAPSSLSRHCAGARTSGLAAAGPGPSPRLRDSGLSVFPGRSRILHWTGRYAYNENISLSFIF